MNFKNIITSWKTSLIGLIILCGLAYTGFTEGFTISEAIAGLIALGFIVKKDKSLSKAIDQPNPNHEEK